MADHLPERERPWVRRKLRAAWEDPDHHAALRALEALASGLEREEQRRRRNCEVATAALVEAEEIDRPFRQTIL